MKRPTYPKFKESGVEWLGQVPGHWDVMRIRHLFEIRKRISGELGHNVLSITQKGIKVKDTESGEGQLSMDYSKYQFVEEGDFAMNHMDLLTGYVDISKHNGVTSPDYRVFAIKDKSRCYDQYFLYLMQLGYNNKIFFAYGQGSSQLGRWRFPTEQFNDFYFPVPSYDEQKAIASFLDEKTALIDDLIAKKERQIELMKLKRSALINRVVTKGINSDAPMKNSGIKWMGQVPEHWSVKKIKFFASFTGGGTPSKDRLDYWNGTIPWVSPKDMKTEIISDSEDHITEAGLESSATKLVASGSVLMVVRSGILKHSIPVAINDRPVTLNQDMKAATFNNLVIAKYFYYFVTGNQLNLLFEWRKAGATVESIEQEYLLNSMMPIPTIEEQTKIVEFIDDNIVSNIQVITKISIQIEKLYDYRLSLISAAVTGKINISEQ